MESDQFNQDYLTFVIDDKTFAVPVLSLQGIIGNPNIIPITSSSDFVVGIFYMNNFHVPILDLRVVLDRPNQIYFKKTCVVVLRVSFKGKEKLVGFIVDSLFNINHIQVSDIEQLPSCEGNDFIEGVCCQQEKIILLLNMGKIINKPDVICFLNQFWNRVEIREKKLQ